MDADKDRPSKIVAKPNLEYVEIKTDYFFKEEDTKRVKVGACERSGNLLIGYVSRVQIYKFFKRYCVNDRSQSNNFVHLLDVKIKFDAEHFRLAEQLLLCSSIEHCQVVNLDFQAEIQLHSNIKLADQFTSTPEPKREPSATGELKRPKEQTIYLPTFQNEQLKLAANSGHLSEIIGPISDRLCCKLDIKFDPCLQVTDNNVNVLFCLNLITTKASLVEHQFEIIEVDGYSQVYHKDKHEIACKTFLLPAYDRQPVDEQLNEVNNPLSEFGGGRTANQNPLHSPYNSKLIYFNFFVFKNDYLIYYLIDQNFRVEKFKLNQMDIKNFNLKSVAIDESFIYVLTRDSLYTYYFGLFNILNNVHQLKFTSVLDQNLNELLKKVRPLLLNKNSFLGSHQLINNPVQLIVLSQDDQIFTKYSLKKPTYKQSLLDAKESLPILEQELNQKQKINFYFYLINLCKSIELAPELAGLYRDYSLVLLKLLLINFPTTSAARKLIMEFVLKYTDLKLIDLIEQDEQFIYKHYDQMLKPNESNLPTKSILEELLEHLIYEDKLNQAILYDSLYYYYEEQELLSKRVFDKLDDSNVLKLMQYLTASVHLVVYLTFKHRFGQHSWPTLQSDLVDRMGDELPVVAKAKLLFDCGKFDELQRLILATNEMKLYCELTSYKEFVVPSIDFLDHLVKLDLLKMIRFIHKLITSNISSDFIFSIFKDNKLLFIMLDNLLCTTRSEQIPEKLLTNLVVNYWKILNNELNYEALCDEFAPRYQWTVYQTPFINMLRPYHDEDRLTGKAFDGVDGGEAKENDDKCLNMKHRNDPTNGEDKSQQPIDQLIDQCLCSVCSPTFNKLQFILNVYSSNNEIRSLLNHLIKNTSQTSWSWRIQVQISDFSDAIAILYERRPEAILLYILEQQTMGDQKWTLLIDFLNRNQQTHGLDTKLNHKILYHLANILSPLEFIKLIPAEWKPITNWYIKICIEKYQSKCIKKQILNYLEKDYVTSSGLR